VDFDRERDRMVAEQLEARGLRDRRVLTAMRRVPRHRFVDPAMRHQAYDDTALPIGRRQTISQPYMVAVMTEALELAGGERVLEVGAGCGYQAAVLAEMGAFVTAVDIVPELVDRARATLGELGLLDRVAVEHADGTLGWPAGAPWDAILVSAGAPQLPRPLLEQLAPMGRLVLPMGEEELQTLVRVRRGAEGLVEDYLGECRFVPLRGRWGWDEDDGGQDEP
jgi:protein-L-isoaspartate(D-aspartate) O-methyltransferase